MFDNIAKFFKKFVKNKEADSKDTAKERLHLVLMQDRANVSADFLELMKQEIIDVIKKYIDVDETSIDVKLTNKTNGDGTTGAPILYANIPIVSIKDENKNKVIVKDNKEQKQEEVNKPEENDKKEKVEEKDAKNEEKEVEESKEITKEETSKEENKQDEKENNKKDIEKVKEEKTEQTENKVNEKKENTNIQKQQITKNQKEKITTKSKK